MINKPLVVFHGPDCLDGIGAAWCMWQHLGENAEYVMGRYQRDVNLDFKDRIVYLVDFSYSRAFLEEHVLPFAVKVVLLDHHKSALDNLQGITAANFDMSHATNEKSGAMIAWDYYAQNRPLPVETPAVIEHIQDRDLWRFRYSETRPLSAYLFAENLDFRSIDKYMTMSNQELYPFVKLGEVLVKAQAREAKTLIEISRRTFFLYSGSLDPGGNYDGEDCDVIDLVNAPPQYSSEIGGILAKEMGVGGTYYDSEHHRNFSLRSDGRVDVSAICAKFGGGGHHNSAGFKVKRTHPLAKV